MFCPKCGKENSNENRFCFNCGSPLPVTGEENSTETNTTEEGTVAPETSEGEGAATPETNEGVGTAVPETGKTAEDTGNVKPGTGNVSVTIDGNVLKLILSGSGVIIAILYAFYALRGLSSLFNGISMIFNGRLLFGLDYAGASVLTILSRVIMVAGLLLFALSRDDERDNTESLLLVVASCGILRIVIQFISQLIRAFAYLLRYGRFSFSGVTMGKAILFALLAVAIEVSLSFAAGYRPFIGKTTDDLMNEIKNLPNVLLEEIEILSKKYREKAGQKQAGANGESNGSESGPDLMNEKRSYLVYLLVGMITCGIYSLYVVYTFARDVNIICKEDGETTTGLIKLILFSIITCSIYSFVWYYKMLTRVERQEKNWGIQPITVGGIELGAAWLLMKIVGMVISICGIGVIISCYADYLIFRNLNELSKEYNKRIMGQGSGTV